MATCLCFLRVRDIAPTIRWYERLGFECVATHEEPGCELDWALLDFKGARFMLYPQLEKESEIRDAGLYFLVDSIDDLVPVVQREAEVIEISDRTAYGKREIVFRDLNGFQITFGCD